MTMVNFLEKYRPLLAPEGGGGSGAGSGAAGAGGTGDGGAGGTGAPPPWHQGIDSEISGWAQSKGWIKDDPKEAFSAAVKAHREAQKLIGVPQDELIRMPKPNAPEADLKVYLGKLGIPTSADDYDLAAVKFADGSGLSDEFNGMIRSALQAGRVPKDRAVDVVKALVAHMDAKDAAESAERTTHQNESKEALRKMWGTNFAVNTVKAQEALGRIGQAAGLTADQTMQAWDALSKIGGVGAQYAAQMLFLIHGAIGEDKFVGGAVPSSGGGMTPEQAKAEIKQLQMDPQFRKRLLEKGVEENRKWNNLHKIAWPAPAV